MSRRAASGVASAVVLVGALAAATLALGPMSTAAAAAREAPSATSVINGETAAPGSFPYLAFVVYEQPGSSEICSGTVVSSNVILTAAHCVVDEERGVLRPASGFTVVTGNVNWTSSQRVVSAVSAVAVYPEYAWTGEYAHWGDAAVLELSQPISAPPVKLASSEVWTAGSAALMVGWGKVTPSQTVPTSTLRYGSTAVQSAAYCASKSSHFHPTGQVCVLDTVNHLRSACSGDSGGPLVIVAPGTTSEPLEIGIASFIVTPNCSSSSPQYYTRADLVAGWVGAQIAAAAPAPASPAPTPAPVTAAPALPRLGDRAAKGFVRTALTESFASRFEHRRRYRVSCEVLEATKRACKVGWSQGAFLYAGWVTVFYALEGSEVVWRYGYRVKRTAAECASRHCPARVFRG
jgi:secreted trypsin-like serine protease